MAVSFRSLKVRLVSCFRVDNNHLLLLMIHVFRENEEQLFKVKTAFFYSYIRTVTSLLSLLLNGSVARLPVTF